MKDNSVVYIKEAWATEKRYDSLKPKNVPPEAQIWYLNTGELRDARTELMQGKARSPMFLPEKFARYFIRITDVRAERLIIANLSPKEIALEGGQEAIDILKGNDGKWHFRYEFEEAEKPR